MTAHFLIRNTTTTKLELTREILCFHHFPGQHTAERIANVKLKMLLRATIADLVSQPYKDFLGLH